MDIDEGSEVDDTCLRSSSPRGDGGASDNEETADGELEELRRVRRALGKMNQGIENVQDQMKYFNSNLGQTTQLLDIWVRILSQTAHNQRFVLDEEWQGGRMDRAKLEDLVQRDIQRQAEAERQAQEQEARREREQAEARERERQRAEHATAMAESAASRQAGGGQRRGEIPGRRTVGGLGSSSRGAETGARQGRIPGRGRGRGRGGAAGPSGSSVQGVAGSRIRPPR
ncbi:hypothetical protein GGF46_002963 [Coemansia sp. RSA 552]|nr:hypothetical protein GGF46_002963 [Coemansia sp. RSA 552]